MKDNYTPNEVATLIEDLRGDFRAVTEVMAPLPARLTAVENRLATVESEVKSIKDIVRIAIPSLSKHVSTLETKAGV